MTNQHSSDPYAVIDEAVAFLTARLDVLADQSEAAAPHPATVLRAAAYILRLYREKNPGYKDSWCRRGESGIFHNIARKFDRIEADILAGVEPPMNDVADLASYALLYVAWRLRKRGEDGRDLQQ